MICVINIVLFRSEFLTSEFAFFVVKRRRVGYAKKENTFRKG